MADFNIIILGLLADNIASIAVLFLRHRPVAELPKAQMNAITPMVLGLGLECDDDFFDRESSSSTSGNPTSTLSTPMYVTGTPQKGAAPLR